MPLLTYFVFIIKNSFSIIAGIFGIGFIIGFHEFGHFLFGKLFKLNIPSFSIGFGPQILKTKIGSTQFSLSAIPIGGYVEVETGNFYDPQPHTLASLAYWKKMMIIGGGIAFNIIFAYAVFFGLSLTGIPDNPFYSKDNQHFIKKIEKNSSAEKCGLLPEDTIISINGKQTDKNLRSLLNSIKQNPNKTVEITVKRNQQKKVLPVEISGKKIKGKVVGSLGAHFNFKGTKPKGLIQSLKEALIITHFLMTSTLQNFVNAITKKSAEGFGGPLMMISMSAQTAGHSFSLFMLLLALISISLAVLNLLPLPILDGGQAVTHTIEAILQKPLSEKMLNSIHYFCWIMMLAFFIYLTFKDIILMWF